MVNVTASYEELERGILKLPVQDRSKLACRLLESLEGEDYEVPDKDFQLSPEWEAELDRRVKAMDDGTAVMIPAEEFWKEVNQIYGTHF